MKPNSILVYVVIFVLAIVACVFFMENRLGLRRATPQARSANAKQTIVALTKALYVYQKTYKDFPNHIDAVKPLVLIKGDLDLSHYHYRIPANSGNYPNWVLAIIDPSDNAKVIVGMWPEGIVEFSANEFLLPPTNTHLTTTPVTRPQTPAPPPSPPSSSP